MDDSRPDLVIRCLGGRYPHRLATHRPETIQTRLRICGDELRIRIDDDSNTDRWEEFSLPVALLLTWLNRHGDPVNTPFSAVPSIPLTET